MAAPDGARHIIEEVLGDTLRNTSMTKNLQDFITTGIVICRHININNTNNFCKMFSHLTPSHNRYKDIDLFFTQQGQNI